MSVLAHLCRGCGHPDPWHEPVNRGYVGCPCCRAGTSDPDPEPTLLRTATSPGGVDEPLWAPGTRRNVGTMHVSIACACQACRRAAARLLAGAAHDARWVGRTGS